MVFPTRLLAQRAPLARRLRTARPLVPHPFAAQRFQAPVKRWHTIRTITTTRPRWADPTSDDKTGEASPDQATTNSSAPTTKTPPSKTKTTPSTTKASPAATRAASTTKPSPTKAPPTKPAPNTPQKTTYPHLRVPTRTTPSPPAPAPTAHPDVDWSTSYYGIGGGAFAPEATAVLRRPLDPADVEIKPDGIVFLPEIKYRAILLEAFGAGGWGMVPKGEPIILSKLIVREWALIVNGRFVSQARGENNYFGEDQIPRAIEATKSNALMRCCKDLGVAAELWDRRYVSAWKQSHCDELWVEHVVSKKRARIFLKKGDKVEYPFKVAAATRG